LKKCRQNQIPGAGCAALFAFAELNALISITGFKARWWCALKKQVNLFLVSVIPD
jgi:hypothetical protein